MTKRVHCAWCGEDLGDCQGPWSNEPESCGKPECNREVNAMVREQEDEARERAEQDGYSRYGGPGRW